MMRIIYNIDSSKIFNRMKPFNIIVTGEPAYINSLINCISYGPDDLITHKFKAAASDEIKQVQMNFGSLQVDEDNRIDFFGGNDPLLFEFIDSRPEVGFKGLIITLDADNSVALDDFKNKLLTQQNYLDKYALVVGVAGNDYSTIKQAEQHIRLCLTELGAVVPVFSIDPDNKQDVGLLVEALLCSARPGIQETSHGKSSFETIEAAE